MRTLRRTVLLLLTALLAAVVLRWISLERWRWNLTRVETESEPTPTPEPTRPERSPTPTRPPVISGKLESARLFNGITLHATVEPAPGRSASEERVDPESYVLDLKLRARIPAPNKTIDELAKVNPELPRLLPQLAAMITPESPSPWFEELYATKLKALRENLARLDSLLSRHNFYDCQAVLQLKHPQTHRRVLLMQADMDVDADGSDSDRLPISSGVSPNFKPFTSFRWAKKTAAPNPYLPAVEEKLKRYEGESRTATAERKRELKVAISQARDEAETLKRFSFLIGAADPYIVLPGSLSRSGGGKIGDYALVIFGNTIYPAIVGDIGPSNKVGEASLRIAKEINANATPNNRPVSDLKVTYFIFSGTAEPPFGPPDLEKLQVKCEALVKEIGGAGVPLHHWENIIPPPPTPTPTASPPTTPAATAADSPSASPSATVAPTFAFPTPTATTPGIAASPSNAP